MWRLSNKLLCWFLKLQDPILCGKLSKEWPKPSHLVAAPHRLCFPLKHIRGCLLFVYCLVFNDSHNTIKKKTTKNHSAQTPSRPWPSCLSPSYPFSWNETKLLTSHTMFLHDSCPSARGSYCSPVNSCLLVSLQYSAQALSSPGPTVIK